MKKRVFYSTLIIIVIILIIISITALFYKLDIKSRLQDTEGITLTTDKTEYNQGETIKITISKNLKSEIIIPPAYYFIEKFEDRTWTKIKMDGCPCFACGAPAAYILESNSEGLQLEWNQKEYWCELLEGKVAYQNQEDYKDYSQQVSIGKYRVVSQIREIYAERNTKSVSTLYSKEFIIK